MSNLLVVVLAYGTGGEHEPLLESLVAAGVPPEDILVVHNPSTLDEAAPRVPKGSEVARASHNRGYAGGMNLGIEHQLRREPELLLLLTHDARLRQGALVRLLEAARGEPRYGVLAPALALAGTDRPFSFGGITRGNGTVTHLRERPATTTAGVAECDWVDGGTMLIRADALNAAGRFDERFWGYCEEADLCLRIQRAGRPIGVVVDALADQSPGGAKRPGPWSYLLTRNGIAYAGRARGRRAMAFFTAWTIGLVAMNAVRVAARAVGLRRGSPDEPWTLVVGMTRGVVDFARGRWGPPPAGLPGVSDLGNVQPSAEDGRDG